MRKRVRKWLSLLLALSLVLSSVSTTVYADVGTNILSSSAETEATEDPEALTTGEESDDADANQTDADTSSSDTQEETEDETEPVTESETEPEASTEAQTESEPASEPESETQSEASTEAQTEPEAASEEETEPETESGGGWIVHIRMRTEVRPSLMAYARFVSMNALTVKRMRTAQRPRRMSMECAPFADINAFML
ncbi:MAG: hypothetical protein LUC27_04185 [Lachnospiraceae bacterium]|nr:hypothetical protein [Lachnospiraceae bacterium]